MLFTFRPEPVNQLNHCFDIAEGDLINPELDFNSISLSERTASEDAEHAFAWTVPDNLSYFEGHFPDQPILPAVGIVDASLMLLRRLCDAPTIHLRTIASCKISGAIRPGSKLRILVSFKEARKHAMLRWFDSNETKAICELSLLVDMT